MPARYEAIRDQLIENGTPEKEAKEMAAKIYNSSRKVGEPPVHGKEKKRKKKT